MTSDHLRPVLDSVGDSHLVFMMGEQLARAKIPPDIAIRLGRLTALQKPTGGVRGIVAGEMLRRNVVERATAPVQYLMSTRAGTECVTLQALSELDPRATIVSIDGVSALDLISRPNNVGGFDGSGGWF